MKKEREIKVKKKSIKNRNKTEREVNTGYSSNYQLDMYPREASLLSPPIKYAHHN